MYTHLEQQKPLLKVEVGALCACLVKYMRGVYIQTQRGQAFDYVCFGYVKPWLGFTYLYYTSGFDLARVPCMCRCGVGLCFKSLKSSCR